MNSLLGPFSWSTLPVFFHSGNSSGVWSPEALAEIGRYSMATFEKAHANKNGRGRQEHILPGECQRVKAAAAAAGDSKTNVVAMYYLNSVFDWAFYELHDLMLDHPEWRLKDTSGEDITITGRSDPVWCFNLSIPELRERWISDCLQAVADGCDGCYIDRSNNMNIERHIIQELAPVDHHSHQQLHERQDAFANLLPPLLKAQGGLTGIPHDTLRQNLQPVINALEKMDAELLLDLQPSEQGPIIRDG